MICGYMNADGHKIFFEEKAPSHFTFIIKYILKKSSY